MSSETGIVIIPILYMRKLECEWISLLKVYIYWVAAFGIQIMYLCCLSPKPMPLIITLFFAVQRIVPQRCLFPNSWFLYTMLNGRRDFEDEIKVARQWNFRKPCIILVGSVWSLEAFLQLDSEGCPVTKRQERCKA